MARTIAVPDLQALGRSQLAVFDATAALEGAMLKLDAR